PPLVPYATLFRSDRQGGPRVDQLEAGLEVLPERLCLTAASALLPLAAALHETGAEGDGDEQDRVHRAQAALDESVWSETEPHRSPSSARRARNGAASTPRSP